MKNQEKQQTNCLIFCQKMKYYIYWNCTNGAFEIFVIKKSFFAQNNNKMLMLLLLKMLFNGQVKVG